jgi:hypothetical protein
MSSSWLATNGLRLDEPEVVPAAALKQLAQLEASVVVLLERALEFGHVTIITNAETGWVELSARKFMPGVLGVLQRVHVMSARSSFERLSPDSPADWKVRGAAPRPLPSLSFAPCPVACGCVAFSCVAAGGDARRWGMATAAGCGQWGAEPACWHGALLGPPNMLGLLPAPPPLPAAAPARVRAPVFRKLCDGAGWAWGLGARGSDGGASPWVAARWNAATVLCPPRVLGGVVWSRLPLPQPPSPPSIPPGTHPPTHTVMQGIAVCIAVP